MRVVWIGPFYSDTALKEKRAVNQAAAKWSRGLLRGLAACGCEIHAIGHCTEQRWPRGRVLWQNNDAKWFLDWFPCERIAYCNAVGLKERWLAWAYGRAVRKVVKSWRPDFLLCYNSLHAEHVAAMRVASELGVRCVPIILDGDDPRRDNWAKLLRDNRFASGVVFLSYWMYQNYPNQSIPLLHMDGGADEFRGEEKLKGEVEVEERRFTLVHTGALDYWRGLNFMKDIVRLCARQDVRFVFCGKCDRAAMWAEFGNDPRVEVKGFVPNEEVDAICRSADAFLNVRDPKIGDNILNYPSKVPQYLAWGKPVVSTWIDSFSPDYRDVLDICDNTPEGFVRKIDEVLGRDVSGRAAKFNQIRDWYTAHKTWRVQAGRLCGFLKSV